MSSLFFSNLLMLAFWSPGPAEMLVLAVVALLLYGGNLPEVARSWGKSFAEFRRGLSGFQNELNEVIYSEPEQLEYRDDSQLEQGYVDTDYVDTNYVDSNPDDAQTGETEEFHSEYAESTEENQAGTDEQSKTDEADESDLTVKDASAETVILDKPKDKPAS